MTALRVPQVSLECQVLKGTRVFRASQGEKAQMVKREMRDPEVFQDSQEQLVHREIKESRVQMEKLDRKVIRAILEFQASWGLQETQDHQE